MAGHIDDRRRRHRHGPDRHPGLGRAPGAVVSGSPAIDNRAWLKASAVFAKLPELQRRLRELERALESLLAETG